MATTHPKSALSWLRRASETSPTTFDGAGVQPAAQVDSPRPDIRSVLILLPDRLLAKCLLNQVQPLFANAAIDTTTSIAGVNDAMRCCPPDVLIANLVAADGLILSEVARWRDSTTCGVVVLACRSEPLILDALSRLPVQGVIDTHCGGLDEIQRGVSTIAAGRFYWSPGLQQRFYDERLSARSVLGSLTDNERLILTIIGGGCDDQFAADLLDISPHTVKTVRRSLHRKLDVRNRTELLNRARQLGFDGHLHDWP